MITLLIASCIAFRRFDSFTMRGNDERKPAGSLYASSTFALFVSPPDTSTEPGYRGSHSSEGMNAPLAADRRDNSSYDTGSLSKPNVITADKSGSCTFPL
jgi:hypothetical protein